MRGSLVTRKDLLARLVTTSGLGIVLTVWAPAMAIHVDEANRPATDNSGKKLASVSSVPLARPLPGSAAVSATSHRLQDRGRRQAATATAAQVRPLHVLSASHRQQNSWAVIKGLPEELVARLKDLDEESVDVLQVVSARLHRFVGIRIDELWRWWAELYKQVISTPVATPFGSPYVHSLPRRFNPVPDTFTKMLADPSR